MGLNKLVDFSIAKMLKDKGYSFEFIEHGEMKDVLLNIPTLSDVVMWFYEKHKIWISVDGEVSGMFIYYIKKYNSIETTFDVKKTTSLLEYYISPTLAYEAAIEYVLTKLI
jgi:hypothetical protein